METTDKLTEGLNVNIKREDQLQQALLYSLDCLVVRIYILLPRVIIYSVQFSAQDYLVRRFLTLPPTPHLTPAIETYFWLREAFSCLTFEYLSSVVA